jgi:predicted Zn-dependent peptidase
MLDRTVPPPFRTVDKINFSWPKAYPFKEGLPLFVLNEGNQPIIKIELICDAGSWYEPHNGVAYFTAKMLQEGTQYKSAQDIAHYIDQYGASFHVQVQPDTCTLTLVTLSKHLVPMLVLLAELLLAPTFDAQRLAHLKQLTTQRLKVDAQRNSHVAHKKLKAMLFDSAHPYGRQLTEAAITNITPAHLKHYYENRLLAGCRLLVSGKVDEKELQTIQKYLQPLPIQAPDPTLPPWPKQTCAQVLLKKEASLQAAISMGKVLFSKDHPDYLPLLVVNELLGGYFGSRLMRNIRENKGYTYGIFSNIVSLKYTSYLLIATEVTQAFAQATCQEIAKEIKVLQTVPVPEEELKTLKNYMLGTFLSEINDPFAIMNKFKSTYLYGLDRVYYEQWYNTIRHISPPQIMRLANAYLATDSFSQVIVG